MQKKIPLYLQTDIGGDIDDFWALVMLLKQPWIDLKMILTDTGDTVYRAAICAKLLQLAGRDDVEIGAGLADWPIGRHARTHIEWVKDYALKSYKNYTQCGVERFIERLRAEEGPVTLMAIGPVTSLGEALRRAPDIAQKCNFVGMFGSVYKGYNGGEKPEPEYNVYIDVEASKRVFSADWLSASITPLDTCGIVRLTGDLYQRIEASQDKFVKEIVDVYTSWSKFYSSENWTKPVASSTLFDTVAAHMVSSREFLKMKEVKLVVDDRGMTIPDPAGKPFQVAYEWTDLAAYEAFLVDTLTK